MKKNHKYNFTDELFKSKPVRESGRAEIGDTQVQGLIARYNKNGTASFYSLFRVRGAGGISPTGKSLRGKQQRMFLGTNEEIAVDEARAKSLEIRSKAGRGIDPRDELRTMCLLRNSNKVEAVVPDFIRLYAKPNTKAWRNAERSLNNYFVKKLGNKPITDITKGDVHSLLDEIVNKEKIGAAREVRKHMGTFFSWAVSREICRNNPLTGLKRIDLAQNNNAGRSLTDEEVKAFYLATFKLGYPFGDMYRLLLFTGQRRNEWAEARIEEINISDRCLEVPRERYKSKRDHIIYFSDEVKEMVEKLPKWAYSNYYLFTTTAGRVPVSGFGQAKKRLDALMEEELCKMHGIKNYKLEPYRIHDLRVTCETRLANLGFNQDVRDRVLGHASRGLQKIYNKYDYANEKREAMNAYAKHLKEIIQ